MQVSAHPPATFARRISETSNTKTDETKPKIVGLGKICGAFDRSVTRQLSRVEFDETNPTAAWVKYSEKVKYKDKSQSLKFP
jgi:hypothetical protein